MNSSAAPSRHFLPSIEGLRAVAILMVVAFHARVPGCTGGLVGLTFGSLLVSLAVTQRHSQIWSFYLPFTRGWEFGAGAVLAIWQEEASLPRSRWTDLLGWSSFLGLLALLPLFPADRHPGLVTLAPVMGALGCIAASGSSRFGLARLLDSRPMQWIGGLSYSWYLLHRPLLVYLQAFTIHLRWQSDVPVSVMGLGLAWLMKRYVEDPCRYRLLRFRSAKGLVAFVIFCATIASQHWRGILTGRIVRTIGAIVCCEQASIVSRRSRSIF
ncbi:MAG: hypothetical protein RL173_160 [Fibrobacterota bacterium]|jgi:peptidoglycan/LPS O-acetylase OafA/YrhL